MAGPGNILIKVGADAGQAVRELSKVDKSLGDTMTTSQKMGAGLKKAALPAAAALGAIGYAAIDATKAAAEDAAAQEKLAAALKRTTGASDAQIAATEDFIDKTALATGVADDELRPALENIAVATKDVGKAQKLMSAALDISAASGKDVDTVSKAIAKAYTGQTSSLEKLVPGLSKAAKKSDDFNVIMGELAKTTGGAAAVQANTAAGQFKRLGLQMDELQETIGAALLPVVEKMLPLLKKFADFASKNSKAVTILVGVIGALAGGILVANAAMKAYAAAQFVVRAATAAWTAAQWLLNQALTANPIGLVIIAVGALAAAFIVAYKKSETFRNIVQGALGAVKSAVNALDTAFDKLKTAANVTYNWIVDHWKVALFAFGPIGAAVYAIVSNFDSLKSAASSAASAVEGAISKIVSAFNRIKNWTFGAVESAIRRVGDALNGVVAAVQSLIGWLGRIKVPSIRLPHIGKPWMVAPAAPAARGARGARAAEPESGGVTVNVYGAIDPEGTARAVRRVLESHRRRQGAAVGTYAVLRGA